MSNFIEDAWSWLKTAPLPVVLAITVALGGWVYSVANDVSSIERDVASEKARAEGVRQTVDKIDNKLDKLLEAVADLKAEQRVLGTARDVRDDKQDAEIAAIPTPHPSPRSRPRKEK